MNLSRGQRIFFAVANLFSAAITGGGVWFGLPSRWLPLDATATVVALLLAASAIALLVGTERAETLTRLAAIVSLIIGLATFAALAMTASWLHGVYGPIGRGGSAVFALVAALVLPYLVVLPAAELVWLGPRKS